MSELAPVPGDRADFDYAFARSRWAEEHAADLVNQHPDLAAVPYGRSRTRAAGADRNKFADDHIATETLGKRPDLLVFERERFDELRARDDETILELEDLPNNEVVNGIASEAVGAIEVENSVWWAKDMPKYGKPSPRKWKGTKYDGIGFTGDSGFPHVFLKDDDLERLRKWQAKFGVPIYLAQFYLDCSFLMPLSRVEEAIADGALPVTPYRYSAHEIRDLYKVWYTLGAEFGILEQAPSITAGLARQHSAKAVGEVVVTGGRWRLCSDSVSDMLPR